jgi:hypothetical protein
MKNKFNFSLVVFFIFLSIFWYSLKDEPKFESKQPTIEENPINAEIKALNLTYQPQIDDESGVTSSEPNKKIDAKSEAWCVDTIGAPEHERVRQAQLESEWNIQRGAVYSNNQDMDIFAVNAVVDYVIDNDRNSILLEPYLDMSKEELLKTAENGDKLAYLELIERPDLEVSTRKQIAIEMLKYGYTEKNLTTLISSAMSNALFDYKYDGNVVSDLVRDNVLTALIYVEYGLRRKDASGLGVFLQVVNDHNEFKTALSPVSLFGEQTLAKMVSERVDDLIVYIDKVAIESNLQPISQTDLPEIADRVFDVEMGVFYSEFESTMTEYEALNIWRQTYLKENTCTKQIKNLFANRFQKE